MGATFGRGSRSRAVLAAIVADPDLGPAVLSHPATLFSLLSDYLPDSPRETGPLLAAAQVDIPGLLRDFVDDGLPGEMAIEEAATSLADRTSLPDEACLWAVREFALALGLTATDEPVLAAAADEEPFARFNEPRWHRSRRPRPGRSFVLRTSLATVGAVVAVAGATGIVMRSQHHEAGPRQPHPGVSRQDPGSPAASARPSAGDSGPGSANAHTSAHSAAHSRTNAASPHRNTASPHASPTSTATPAPADPAVIARDYIASVNERDWPWSWQLGGGNVLLTYQSAPGPLTYPQMVAEFQHTVWVSITSLISTGNTVTMRVSALDSAGVTQYYQLNLVIGSGRIISGSQYLLGP